MIPRGRASRAKQSPSVGGEGSFHKLPPLTCYLGLIPAKDFGNLAWQFSPAEARSPVFTGTTEIRPPFTLKSGHLPPLLGTFRKPHEIRHFFIEALHLQWALLGWFGARLGNFAWQFSAGDPAPGAKLPTRFTP